MVNVTKQDSKIPSVTFGCEYSDALLVHTMNPFVGES